MKSVQFLQYIKNFTLKAQKQMCEKFFEHKNQLILNPADVQVKLIFSEANRAISEQLEKRNQECLQQLEKKSSKIENKQKEIAFLEEKVKQAEENLIEKQVELSQKEADVSVNQNKYNQTLGHVKTLKHSFENALESHSRCEKKQILHDIRESTLNENILEINRLALEKQEQLKTDAQKVVQKVLQSIYYRYQPRFIWPKSAFSVEFTNEMLVEKYFAETSPILNLLLENTSTSLNVLETENTNQFLVKIVGGLGVDKEIIRLTLEECRTKKILNADKILSVRNKYKDLIDHQIMSMGHDATKLLGIEKIHPEILKLIGSLNFRTSHRQNQYYHSLEVAILSGMIANELGLDSQLAKRSGLLHDIGKVLDYKIEGSHAVISGDYAAKYHENIHVVDTVLAHHDDKIVETPHAFILKAADAMSGARPGARVDMEDGYNRRLDGISSVVQSFQNAGVTHSAIMHAGREVHVYVDTKKTPHTKLDELARNIAEKLEIDVEYPGQIRVTVIRRTEVSAVA